MELQIGEYIIEFGIFDYVVLLLYCGAIIAGGYAMLQKANLPGWHVFIPFYNTWEFFKVAWGKGIYMLLLFIPLVNGIIAIMYAWKLAKAYKHGIGIFLLTFFMPPIAFMIMGFDHAPYVGPYEGGQDGYNWAYDSTPKVAPVAPAPKAKTVQPDFPMADNWDMGTPQVAPQPQAVAQQRRRVRPETQQPQTIQPTPVQAPTYVTEGTVFDHAGHLAGQINAMNQPFRAVADNNKVVITWRWKDAARFGIPAEAITEEVQNFRYTVYLLPEKKYKLTATKLTDPTANARGAGMSQASHKDLDLFGKDYGLDDEDTRPFVFTTKAITGPVKQLLRDMGYSK